MRNDLVDGPRVEPRATDNERKHLADEHTRTSTMRVSMLRLRGSCQESVAMSTSTSSIASSIPRKSAYGRTQLFLPDTTTLFREVKCMGGILKRDTLSVWHVLPEARSEAGACCWHCCESIGEDVIPIPRLFADGVYHVFGRTCCPGCTKAYILEHSTFNRGHQLNVLIKMLWEVYGIQGPVWETPPRPALRRFGGVFDTRKATRVACKVVEPPFVSYCMIAEEHAKREEVMPCLREEEEALREPQEPGLFKGFLEDNVSRLQKKSPVRKRKGPLLERTKGSPFTRSGSSSSSSKHVDGGGGGGPGPNGQHGPAE